MADSDLGSLDSLSSVIARHDPAISIAGAPQCHPERDGRVKPDHDG